MISPGISTEPQIHDEEIGRILTSLGQLWVADFESQTRTIEAMNRYWITASVLKAKRHGKYDDAFILWISTRTGTVAIKIHPDCFTNCKRIYDNPNLRGSFQQDADIAPIISTFCAHHYRVVLYPWQSGISPLQALSETQERELLTKALQDRIDSLFWKGHGLHGTGDEFTYPEHHEFLLIEPASRLIVLDINQIIPIKQLPISSHELAQRLIETWIQREKRK